MSKTCVRCARPIPPEERRQKYCSDACADSAARAAIKVRGARGQARLLYRFYPPPTFNQDTKEDPNA